VREYYVPGLGEKDSDKIIRSLMQAHQNSSGDADDIATNTAAIAAINAAGHVVGPASATDNALARYNATTGKLIQNSEITLGDTDGKLTRASGISLSGTNTNDSAASGYVGELLTASATVALTTGTPANLTSLSITAGDWDVFAIVQFDGAGASVTSDVWASLGTTSATMNSVLGQSGRWRGAGTTDLFFPMSFSLRVSLASTTTYYLTGQASFTTSTYGGRGLLRARRVR
jgi:hypothetical protein